jgi:hypothetical protein
MEVLDMRGRSISTTRLAVAAVAALWLAFGSLTAQGPRSKGAIPRTPDGRPDLQGIYDVSTMTPVERAPEFGDRLVITDKEAAVLEEYEQQRKARSEAASDPNRSAPPVGGEKGYLGTAPKSLNEQLFAGGGGTVGGYNNFWLAMGERLLTIDGKKRTSIVVDPPDGRVPAMKPAAKQRNAELLARTVSPDANEASVATGPASAFDDPELRPLAERCLLGFGSTSGPPTLPNYFYNNLKQIVQTPNTIILHNEMVHDARIVRIGGQHPPAHIRKWMGDSIGRWEGDTLVIETTNFTNKTQFRGSGENLKVIERISRLDDKTLLYRFTVEDPDTWEKPWSGEYPWVLSSEKLYEYACHESNYSLAGILKGARVQEAEAAGKQR